MVTILKDQFEGFYDHGKKRYVSSKREVKEIEAREGKVWASDKELMQETAHQRKRKQEEFNKNAEKFAKDQAERIWAQRPK